MRWQRLAVILTVLNFLLLIVLIGQFRPVTAASDVAPVLRGRALELLDEKGRVRAEIKVFPAQPNLKMPDGTIGISEVVELRLIDSNGGPHIKLSTLEDGSGLLLGGEGGYLQLLSRGPMSLIKMVNKDGRVQTIATSEQRQPTSK
jgi:hypothetical protein